MSGADGGEHLENIFATLGLDRDAVPPPPPDVTLRPGDLGRERHSETQPAPAPPSLFPFLPSITLAESKGEGDLTTATADLLVGDMLGEGGMGKVHRAEQRSLDRAVAIKRPTAESGGKALIDEARTMAHVDHPNVVPVYNLGRDAGERPVLVMKRVVGASLAELLRDRNHPAWPRLLSRWGDRERATLGILGEVADALSLAHSRNIVHRDVKPDNVMVGEFGEVYLLDWGIACAASGPDTPRDSIEEEPGAIAGTPGYMAPEMVLRPGVVDARTDVYLLGATLHHVLTGALRHRGATLFATLSSALASTPYAYGPDVPEDLAALANAATHRDPNERPESAAAFRRALLDHERHRESLGLVRAAREALAPLSDGSVPLTDPTSSARLSEASAALAAAARAHPGSSSVTAARNEQLVLSVEREVALESPASARALFDQLDPSARDARPALASRIEALEARVARAKASEEELARARADAEVASGMRLRIALGLVAFVPLVMLSVLLSSNELAGEGPISMRKIVVTDLGALFVLSAGMLIYRRRMLANRGNRMLSGYGLGGMVMVTASNALSLALGHPANVGIAHTHAVIAGYFLAGATVLTPQFAWGTLSSSVAALTLVVHPEWRPFVSPVAMLVVLATGLNGLRAYRSAHQGA